MAIPGSPIAFWIRIRILAKPLLANPIWRSTGGGWLADAGFRVQGYFVSTLCTNLQIRRPRPRLAVAIRLEQAQAVPIDNLLESIHHLVLEGFQRQPLFRPTCLDSFSGFLQPWRSVMDPRLSLLAFGGPDLVGLLLAHADGPGGRRAVVRTLVVRPGRPWAGLGRRLLETCHGLAADVGYLAVIHALMRDPGASLALSRP